MQQQSPMIGEQYSRKPHPSQGGEGSGPLSCRNGTCHSQSDPRSQQIAYVVLEYNYVTMCLADVNIRYVTAMVDNCVPQRQLGSCSPSSLREGYGLRDYGVQSVNNCPVSRSIISVKCLLSRSTTCSSTQQQSETLPLARPAS